MATNLFDSLSPVAKFAAGLFTAASLNLGEMVAKGDVNALKAHLEGLKTNPDLAAAITEATKSLQAQVETLTGEKATLSGAVASFTASLDQIGLTAEAADKAKFKAAFHAKVTAEARTQLAKAGHAPIEDPVTNDPTKTGAKQSKTLAEFRALNPFDRAKFMALCREGKGELTGLPQIGPA